MEPHLKIRNFKKTLLKGVDRAMSFRRHPKPSAGDIPRRTEDEERPAWDLAPVRPQGFEALEEAAHQRERKKKRYFSQVHCVFAGRPDGQHC